MTDRRISIHDRVLALDRLNALAFEVNQIGAWLATNGVETESDKLELAATHIAAACWLLERPIRARPAAEKWQQAPGGHQAG